MTRGRPPKVDKTAEAEQALERWLRGPRPRPKTPEDLARVREALGETEYAVDETEGPG
jgi:hypothetical protein